MSQLEFLPTDIVLKMASLLEVSDVCSLGSCSWFWRLLCESDCLWAALYRDRWPTIVWDKGKASSSSTVSSLHLHQGSTFKGWRRLYINKHNEMTCKADIIYHLVEQCMSLESIEVADYLRAIGHLRSMHFGFEDAQMFFLKPKLNVQLNLIGLHYCIVWLGVPPKHIMEALFHHKIAERLVRVQWWKIGRWLYGFRLKDESHSCTVSLVDLTRAKDDEVLRVLHRGAVYEVLRIQISAARPTSTSWVCRNA